MLSSVARLRSLALLATVLVVPALLAGTAPARADHDDTPRSQDYQQVIHLTYPADPSTGFSEGYDSPRSGGRVHKATDIMGRKHAPLYATVDGTVCHITGVTEPMPTWGYSLTICDEDGRRHRYIHLNNDNPGTDDGRGGPEWAFAPGIRRGVTVTEGQWVGYLGDSGNAESTAPHLHFEILDDAVVDPYGDHRINPAPSLRAARAAGRVIHGVPAAPAPTPTARVAGRDRIATAIAAAQTTWRSADTAVLAVSTLAADAIAAGPLAASLDGPVLITGPGALDGRVATALRELGTTSVVLVGAAATIPGIETALTHAGVASVERVAGTDVFETAALVADLVWGDTPPRQRSAAVALGAHPEDGRSWPDALMASWYGATKGVPILYVAPETLPIATATALTGIGSAVLVGGTAAIDEPTATAVTALVSRSVRRLSGATRYDTAVAVTAAAGPEVDRSTVWAATGRSWADAVTAGAAVAKAGQVLVLVDGRNEHGDQATGRWLFANGPTIERGLILGGEAAVGGASVERFAHRSR